VSWSRLASFEGESIGGRDESGDDGIVRKYIVRPQRPHIGTD
jgi:hypothetical protein